MLSLNGIQMIVWDLDFKYCDTLRLVTSMSCMQDQKKLQEQLLNEKETLFGSKPNPSKNVINPRTAGIGSRVSSIGGSQQSAANRRLSLGNAIMQPGTPELTRNGNPARMGSCTKDRKPGCARPAAPSNYVSINKDDSSSAGGSAPTSPRFS